MEYNRLLELIEKYRSNNCTKEELDELISFYETVDISENALSVCEDITDEKTFTDQNYSALLRKIRYGYVKRAIPKMALTVSVIAVLWSFGLFLYKKPVGRTEEVVHDIGPGRNEAVLTTTDGKQVLLNGNDTDRILKQGGLQLLNKNGTLVYGEATDTGLQPSYNTLNTPNACTYKLILPDGTKVWLNAASSIRYPAVFREDYRTVELSGEAYFEVVHNEKQPFKIKIGKHVIEDVGTSFNVNNYTDEPDIKTTLSEGAVKIGKTVLHAGQQANISRETDKLTVTDADTEDALAWTKGQLVIDNMDLYELLRSIARWYDVKIEIAKQLPDVHFEGEIDRNINLSAIIKIMGEYGINMQLMNRNLIVSSKK